MGFSEDLIDKLEFVGEIKMEKNSKLKYLLPIRSIMFILIFVIGSVIAKQNLSDISNWWSIVATGVNIITINLLTMKKERHELNKLL